MLVKQSVLFMSDFNRAFFRPRTVPFGPPGDSTWGNHPNVLSTTEVRPFRNARIWDKHRSYPYRMVAGAVKITSRKLPVNNGSG